MVEQMDRAVQEVNEEDEKPLRSRGRDPTPSQEDKGKSIRTPMQSISTVEMESGMSTDRSPKEEKLASELEIANRLNEYTNPQNSPMRGAVEEGKQDNGDESETITEEQVEAEEEKSIDGVDSDETEEETKFKTCNGCGKSIKSIFQRTRCFGCKQFYHAHCLAVSGRKHCEKCAESQETSEGGSESESSTSVDSDEDYIEPNRMTMQRSNLKWKEASTQRPSPKGKGKSTQKPSPKGKGIPTQRPNPDGKGITERGREPEQLLDPQLNKKEPDPPSSATQPPESLRSKTTTTSKQSTDRNEREEPDNQDD